MKCEANLRVKPGSDVNLSKWNPADTMGMTDKDDADAERTANVERLAELANQMWADNRYALLVVLQGMDTAGKDGTIRNVMSGINPRDCRIVSFKAPSEDERDRDYLWRIHKETPRRGEIGVFNRSHYEDVLIVRVRNMVPKDTWKKRYDQINAFEKHLAENGTRIIKFFLHISKDEQKKRLEERIKDPRKNWKMQASDLNERKLWDDYQRAYEEALGRCSTNHAPWYVIPSDRKWFRNLAISSIMCETMEAMDLKWPKADPAVARLVVED